MSDKMREALETIKAALRVDDPHGHYDLVCEALAQADQRGDSVPCAWRVYGARHWNDGPPNQQSIDYYGTNIEYAYPAPAVPVPDVIMEIGRRLIADRRANDHMTADPIYTVQREHRVYRVEEGEGDGAIWLENGEQCDHALSDRLERRRVRGWELPSRFERVEYRVFWEFVDAFLSYEAAKDCAKAMNRKRCGQYRTYVESGCRNHEWQAMQQYFMALAAAPEVPRG